MINLNIPNGLHLRPSRDTDKPFIANLYSTTRDDLRMAEGERDFIESIVEQQHYAQTKGYGELFPNAMYFVIEMHDEKIGSAILNFETNEVRMVDLAFIREARGKGYGKVVVQSFQKAAEQNGVPMSLSVLQQNLHAKKLYIALGFVVEKVEPPYERMIWFPPSNKIFTN